MVSLWCVASNGKRYQQCDSYTGSRFVQVRVADDVTSESYRMGCFVLGVTFAGPSGKYTAILAGLIPGIQTIVTVIVQRKGGYMANYNAVFLGGSGK